MALTDVLDKTLSLKRAAFAKAADGSPVISFGTGTPYACAKWPASSKVVADYAQRNFLAEYEVCTAVDISPLVNDILIIDGLTYTVIGYQRFENAAISDQKVYLTITGNRTTT